MDYYDLYDITPEEEAILNADAAEQEVDDWLAAWSDDFWSDEWAAITTAEGANSFIGTG